MGGVASRGLRVPAGVNPSRSGSGSTKAALYIPSLDGIRACAVMLVFASHAVTFTQVAPRLRGSIPGEFGVTVFFFLSGYLITTLLRKEHEMTARVSLGAFYLRRVLRIFPPFYVVLIAATALSLAGGLPGSPQIQPNAVLAQALYLTNYHVLWSGWWFGHAPGTWIFWSLAVEEHFYLLFPLLYLLLLRHLRSRQRQALLLAGICAAVLFWRFLLVYAFGADKYRTYVATDTRIDSIIFGCILGVFANPLLDRTYYSDRAWKYVWVPIAVVGLLFSFAVRSPHFQWVFAYTLQGICLFPLFIAAVRYPNWAPFRLLNFSWVKFVGIVSYSIYLVHPTVLWAVTHWIRASGVIQTLLALSLTLGLAYVIHRFVEKPANRLRRRLSQVNAPDQPDPAPARPLLRPQREAEGTQPA